MHTPNKNSFARNASVVLALVCMIDATATAAVKVTLAGLTDFPTLKVTGFAQYYKNTDKTRCNGVIEVDADKTGYQFGAARSTFNGETYYYDITIATCTDADGKCKYIMDIGGKPVGDTLRQTKAVNNSTELLTWRKVLVTKGSTVQMMSNGSDSEKHTGGLGPNGFHMAHGRWNRIEFTPVAPATTTIQHARQKSPCQEAVRRFYNLQGRQITSSVAVQAKATRTGAGMSLLVNESGKLSVVSAGR